MINIHWMPVFLSPLTPPITSAPALDISPVTIFILGMIAGAAIFVLWDRVVA